ncbi:putative F-box protein At5g62660 [Rutidosis leptorrhynchoides]|uniref:putative F-box protein At5g62660 n=1 Tax=Rutidosis leptorrhynchoides TaxID=125765 RepID=UPI003A98E702
MSDNVPFEIQIEIIKLLSVKSLVRCRSVSKSWKSLIDSSYFIANYHFSNAPVQHRLLVRYVDSKQKSNVEDEKYVSIVDDDDDDDSFPQNKIPIIAPSDVRLLGKFPDIIGNSQGVICLCVLPPQFCFSDSKTFVLWNPTIRKSVPIVVPNVLSNTEFETFVGFGVCPRTSDPKLVKITHTSILNFKTKCIPSQVEVFNLSSGSWRSLSMNVPRQSIKLSWKQVCIDNFIYWLAIDITFEGQTMQKKNLILSFDMTSEDFTEIDPPNNQAYLDGFLDISKVRTSLLVLESKYAELGNYCVWRMEHGIPNSFTKLFVINSPSESLRVHDFRKTGEPIIRMVDKNDEQSAVCVYNPESEEISDIVVDVAKGVEDKTVGNISKWRAKNTHDTTDYWSSKQGSHFSEPNFKSLRECSGIYGIFQVASNQIKVTLNLFSDVLLIFL